MFPATLKWRKSFEKGHIPFPWEVFTLILSHDVWVILSYAAATRNIEYKDFSSFKTTKVCCWLMLYWHCDVAQALLHHLMIQVKDKGTVGHMSITGRWKHNHMMVLQVFAQKWHKSLHSVYMVKPSQVSKCEVSGQESIPLHWGGGERQAGVGAGEEHPHREDNKCFWKILSHNFTAKW